MHILVISPTKGAKLKSDAQAVPRVGDSIYHKGCCLEVEEVIWWPTKDEKFQDGFEDLNDIFKYISENKYFNPEIYLLENRNHTARVRDKKRKTYMAFLEYCSNNTFDNIYEFNQDIHFYIDMIFLKFPMFLTEYVLCTYDTELARVSKEKLTTEIIRHHTGLDGIDLGNYIKATKLKFNSINDWHHVVIALPVSDILFIMDSNYKEYNQNVV